MTHAVVVEQACVRLTVPWGVVGPDGVVDDEGLRARLVEVLDAMARHLRTAADR